MEEIAKNAITILQDAINNNDWDGVLSAYEIIESDYFNWDDVPEYLFKSWDDLVDEGNDILEGN